MTQNPSKQLTGNDPLSHPEVKNRYKEGTKKYQFTESLSAGEVDRGKVGKIVDVSLTIIYNTTSDLAKHGYSLAIHRAGREVGYSPTPPTSPPTPPTLPHSEPPPVNPASNRVSNQLGSQLTEAGSGLVESRSTQLTSEPSCEFTKEIYSPDDRRSGRADGPDALRMTQRETPQKPQLSGKELPIKDAELVGDKVGNVTQEQSERHR
jgi:hypothetical protein